MKGKTSHLVYKIKEKIREIMDSKNLTQKMMANKMDTSQQSINDLLNNNKDLTITKMEKAAKALEATFTDLLPLNITQHNADGAKEIVQIQTLNINDIGTVIEKIMQNQSQQMELSKQQMELTKQIFEFMSKNKS